MNIDISQFHETFLEEASEHLVDLERGLLSLESGESPDMNAIFRAAHSIKGGAATFGFSAIADFTHVVESVLERARSGDLDVTSELTTELLKSVDIITELLDAAKESRTVAPEDQDRCLKALESYMKAGKGSTSAPAANQEQAVPQHRVMEITFKPLPHLPKTGSDPLNIFRELMDLGDMSVTPHFDELPALADLSHEELHLWWTIELVSDASDEEISDVFLFVEDDAEIDIVTLAAVDKQQNMNTIVTATPLGDARQGERRKENNERRMPERAKETTFIRVSVDKVDNLLNLMGELVTTNAMVNQHVAAVDAEKNQQFSSAISEMGQHTRNLQEAIMSIRMMPIDFAFSRFPRMVRDTSQKLGKQVALVTNGAQTELDKTVIEQISDPLTHLVRNSIDHGIEMPDERVAAGKPAEGTIVLDAFYRGGNVIIEIRDDGKGLSREKILAKAIENGQLTPDVAQSMEDEDVWDLIFESGFSTAAEVTDVSGRGVGMDVVRKNIQSLGGSIQIQSVAGQGSCFTISLPLTMAILDGMATQVGSEVYLVPILNILESLRPTQNSVRTVQNGVEVLDFRGEYLPLLRLSKVMRIADNNAVSRLEDGIAVVVEAEQHKIALFVDDLLGERQVVIKNIEDNYRAVEGISGATILGDGRVAFIMDLVGLVRLANREGLYTRTLRSQRHPAAKAEAPSSQPKPDPIKEAVMTPTQPKEAPAIKKEAVEPSGEEPAAQTTGTEDSVTTEFY